jgi:Big-like domain-containing protein
MSSTLTRLSATAGFLTAAFAACRSGTPGGSTSDSTTPSSSSATPAPSSTSPTPSPTRADSIVLRTDKAQYHAGETMTLTFENKSGASYTFNPCTRTIERESGGGWTPMPDEGRMCTMQAFILAPHATQTGTTELPSPLAAGRYRVAVRMTLDQATGQPSKPLYAVSDPITVP